MLNFNENKVTIQFCISVPITHYIDLYTFYAYRTYLSFICVCRIHADPDPKHCGTRKIFRAGLESLTANIKIIHQPQP
jgi:hypothetical protein